ncbi:hypothetical protein BHM03_00055763 [Ensete ventricosum]|nr:hypothetical protein BHM03_00055763 [Ensete ventricosum]
MHPLRFPNSGIRAKIFVRKIGFKLRVMRLNRIESFYAFLLHFLSEGSPFKGQPGMATTNPLAGAASYSQAPPARGRPAAARPPARGDRLQPRPPCRGAAGCGQAPCKGRPTAAPMQRGGRLRPGPARMCVARARGQTAGATARGWPTAARLPQGAAAARGHATGVATNGLQTASPQGAVDCGFSAHRKTAYRQRHRSQGLPPIVAVPVGVASMEVSAAGVATPWQCGCPRARAAVAYAGSTF